MKSFISMIMFILLHVVAYSQGVTCSYSSFIPSSWTSIGPNKNVDENNLGRVTEIWVDPINANYLLAGTRSSGLWKTTDGGAHWANITSYQLPAMGVGSVAVYNNYIYCTTSFDGSDVNLYNIGIAYSNNYGAPGSWQYETCYPAGFTFTGPKENFGGFTLAFKPGSSILYCSNGKYVYKKDVAAIPCEWSVFATLPTYLPADDNHSTREIDFKPGDNNFIILSPYDGSANDYRYSNNGGASWGAMEVPDITALPEYIAGTRSEMQCSTCILDNTVYTLFKFEMYAPDGSSPYLTPAYFYKYDIATGIPTAIQKLNATINFTYTNDYYSPNDLIVFPDHTNKCIVASSQDVVFKATIPIAAISLTFNQAFGYFSGKTTHPDVRAMAYYYNPATLESHIYIATDGGISRCDNECAASTEADWLNINGEGLTISEFLGFSNAENKKYNILSSAADGNSYAIQNTATSIIYNHDDYVLAGDDYKAAISKTETNKSLYTSNGAGANYASDFKGVDLSDITDLVNMSKPVVPKTENIAEEDKSFTWSQFAFDFDDAGNLRAGTSDVFTNATPFKVGGTQEDWTPYTKSYKSLFSFQLADPTIITKTPITAYAIAYNFPTAQAVATYYATKDIKTVDDAKKLISGYYNPSIEDKYQATDITPVSIAGDAESQIYHSWIRDIAIDDRNPNHIWICFGGNSLNGLVSNTDASKNGKVYYSANGGISWTNVSNGLPNGAGGSASYPVHSLCYWKGSDDIIFAGTDVGVYVWDKAQNRWECYNTNLPYASVNDLEINYCTQSLRACTFGFGLWETPLPNLIDDAVN